MSTIFDDWINIGVHCREEYTVSEVEVMETKRRRTNSCTARQDSQISHIDQCDLAVKCQIVELTDIGL